MNKTLEEFKELRIVYSGRIDEAIKNKDKQALINAKLEYKKILEKYMNFACQFISKHTNRPLSVVKKKGKNLVLRSGKSVLKDTSSIRLSLNFIKLPEKNQNDIKTALDVIEDYYNKIIDESATAGTEQTRIKFQIVFGSIIIPVVAFVLSLVNGLIITKFASDVANINSVKEFYNYLLHGVNTIPLALMIVLDMFIVFMMYMIYSKQSKLSILNKKKFMLLPVTIICLFAIVKPYILLNNHFFEGYNLELELINNLNYIILFIMAIIFYIAGLLGGNYSIGEYKESMNIVDYIILVFLLISLIIMSIWNIVLEFVDLSMITDNHLYNSFINFSFWKYILWLIYISYSLFTINSHVFKETRYNKKQHIICIIVSSIVFVLSLILIII